MAIGHSSSMWLTNRTLLRTHVTFHEFRWNLHITLAKYFEQEDIADLLFSCSFSQSSQVLKQSHETKVVGYCMIAKDK